MSARVHFKGRDGKQYGFLDGVDDTSVLSNVRVQAAKVCTLPVNFLFTLRNTPLSSKQEATLTINRCAKVVGEHPNVLELVIMPTDKKVLTSESMEKSYQSKTQGKDDERCKTQPVLNIKFEGNSHTLRSFTIDEIEDGSISRMEKERRSFWNNLAPKLSCHAKYKQWSVQAQRGIVDIEWTLRKTELLKIEAEQVLKTVHTQDEKNMRPMKTCEEEKKINQKLDCMLKVDFKRKKMYETIEDLHKQLKYPGSTCRHIEDQIRENETALDKLFTELKSAQNALEMTITGVKCNVNKAPVATDYNWEEIKVPELTDEEINEISHSVLEDFEGEDLSD